jgi:CHAT domain-containing protein
VTTSGPDVPAGPDGTSAEDKLFANIDATEAEKIVPYVRRALDAQSDEDRRRAVADGLISWGMVWAATVKLLVEQGQGTPGEADFRRLRDESKELTIEWLGGRRLSDRADEPDRLEAFSRQFIRQQPQLARLRAQAILELPLDNPHRNLREAERLLDEAERHAKETGDEDVVLRVRVMRLKNGFVPEADRIREAERLLDVLSTSRVEVQTEREIRVAATQVYISAVFAARDRGDRDAMLRGVERVRSAIGPLLHPANPTAELDPALLGMLGLVEELGEDRRAATDAFGRAATAAGRDTAVGSFYARFEARLKMAAGDMTGVVEALRPSLPVFEEQYLTAVLDSDVREAAEELSEVLDLLVTALAGREAWGEAATILEGGKSLRLRYRSALRRSQAGQRVLVLERGLWALERRLPLPPDIERMLVSTDRLGAAVGINTRLAEAYREVRAGASELDRRPPAPRGSDEALAVLGLLSTGFLLAIIPGDVATPHVEGRFLPGRQEWLQSLLGDTDRDDDTGWGDEVAGGRSGIDPRPGLDRVLSTSDRLIGEPLAALLRGRRVRRLTVLPHQFLHLVPWWALPSLHDIDIRVAPTAALGWPEATVNPGGRRAVVVVNPTADLPLAEVEGSVVAEHLEAAGYTATLLSGEAAQEQTLLEHMSSATVAHLACHGLPSPLRPDGSSLLLHPGADAEAMSRLAGEVTEWHDESASADEDAERWAPLPGGGRLIETHDDVTGVTERRWELGVTRTLVGLYAGGRLRRLGEAWAAGDISVEPALASCRMVFLSACASSAGALATGIDEGGGLPVAFHLAGVPAVVGALWRINDALAVLTADLIYEAMLNPVDHADPADLAGAVRLASHRLRSLNRDEAIERILGYRRHGQTALQRLALQAYAKRLRTGPERPFSHPYDWAAYTTLGSPRIHLWEER